MIETISCEGVAQLMASDGLFAVFDVRERGEYNDCQIPNTTSLPRSQIEFRLAELVPRGNIPIVVYDEGGQRAGLAAQTFAQLGYEQVSIVDGGLSAWQSDGRETVSGVNVPSKAFGERVHHDRNVPDLSPEELKSLIDSAADLMILDMRTPEEYGRFCIPGGLNVPGGELIHWVEKLRQKPAVIVNCAGRTRSIIGAAALQRLGLTNVRALRNGTMGWVLAGYELENKPVRRGPAAPASDTQALTTALTIAAEEGLAAMTVEDLIRARAGASYVIDVRSAEEFACDHVRGSINVPGGQAVQRADDFVPVRNAPIIFISKHSARAVMTAYWYRQMGFKNVFFLQGGLDAWTAAGQQLAIGASSAEPQGFGGAKSAARLIDAAGLHDIIESASSALIDVSTSLEYESSHIPGAKWISRGWIDIKLPALYSDRAQSIVLTCRDGVLSVFAARQLAEVGYSNVSVLEGGLRAWSAAGYRADSGLHDYLVPPNDVVLSPSIRGNKEDMQKYLDWELKLKH